jgi:hypothetical protein
MNNVPVLAMETHPLCYIHTSFVEDDHYNNPRLRCGVYSGEEKMTDKRFWRDAEWDPYYRMSKYLLRSRYKD